MSTVTIQVDGHIETATTGMTVAAVLMRRDDVAFRRSVNGSNRGPLCGMGTCFECRVTIDGMPHRRACMTPVADGMVVLTRA